MKKIIPMKQLKERGIKQGDLYFIDTNMSKIHFRGWYLAISEDKGVGITSSKETAHTNNHLIGEGYIVTKLISHRVLANYSTPFKVAEFFRTGDEELLKDIISEVVEIEPNFIIEAVHFGNSQVYSWILPKEIDPFTVSINDIALVETSRGNQYVEIINVKESFNKNINKSVIKIIKKGEF